MSTPRTAARRAAGAGEIDAQVAHRQQRLAISALARIERVAQAVAEKFSA